MRRLHSVDPEKGKCKQSRKRRKSPDNRKCMKKIHHVVNEMATATIVEDDGQIFEMTAEGQLTNFNSEEEAENEQGRYRLSSNKNPKIPVKASHSPGNYRQGKRSQVIVDDVETEVFFKCQENNNATVCAINLDCDTTSNIDNGLEEGECSQEIVVESEVMENQWVQQQTQPGTSTEDFIDNRINTSLERFQNYFDKKFENLSKVMELERHFADNQQHLEVLKARGRSIEATETSDNTRNLHELAIENQSIGMQLRKREIAPPLKRMA